MFVALPIARSSSKVRINPAAVAAIREDREPGQAAVSLTGGETLRVGLSPDEVTAALEGKAAPKK